MKRENLLDCHGMRFRANIDNTLCEGIITVEDEKAYLCQNINNGAPCDDMQGYRYSYIVNRGNNADLENEHITDFELLDEPKSNAKNDIQNAITLLKENGYKVLKQDWIEF